jgi:hypothetical protein
MRSLVSQKRGISVGPYSPENLLELYYTLLLWIKNYKNFWCLISMLSACDPTGPQGYWKQGLVVLFQPVIQRDHKATGSKDW